jgi:cytochrome c biogenesis protein CcmG, thiol:disulfide interchange protein DsbE
MISRPAQKRTDQSVVMYLITAMHGHAIWRAICSAVLAISCLAGLAACGGSGQSYGDKPPDYAAALAGAPAPLAALYAQPNHLLPGGAGAFQKRIAGLRGHPVVVNQWASWCGPCREEFPRFQRASASYGKRVAFVGVDSNDSDAAAKTFLGEDPVPYPSFSDPHREIAQILKATIGLPDTAFFDRKGQLVYTKQGPYTSQAELVADIERYALR